jgi:hypothetical protein
MAAKQLIDDASAPLLLKELSFFETANTVSEIERKNYVKLFTLSSPTNAQFLEFQYTGTDNYVADLKNIMMFLDVKLTDEQGLDLTGSENVAPENGVMHTVFSECNLYIENQLVESTGNLFAYMHYFQVASSYDQNAVHSHYTNAGYSFDSAGQMENVHYVGETKPSIASPTTTNTGSGVGENPGGTGSSTVDKGTGDTTTTKSDSPTYYNISECNANYNYRKDVYARSHVIKLCGPILLAFFLQPKCLIHRTDFKIRFTRSRPEFYLRTGANETKRYKLDILKAELWVPQLKLDETKQLSVELTWRKNVAKYPIQRMFMSYHTLSTHLNISLPNLINGTLPVKMMMGLVDAEAFAGNLRKNCFNFQHFHVEKILLSINSEPIHGMPLEMDYTNHQYAMAYNGIHMANGTFKKNVSNVITPYGFANGYCIYSFSLTPHTISDNGIAYHLIKTGTLQLDMKFATPPTFPVVLILMFIFNNQISIAYDKSVTFDYSA